MTSSDLASYFRHCGIIKKISPDEFDITKVKECENSNEWNLYFLHEESAQKAIEFYDESEITRDCKIGISGLFSVQDTGKEQYDQKREDEWDDSKIVHVIIKNMFDLTTEKPQSFFDDLKNDIKSEVRKSCGPVDRVIVFSTNPQGVVMLKFYTNDVAEKCIKLMNGRWFDQRQLTCEYYDGFTNYKIEESKEQKEKRIKEWSEYVEKQQ
ncbi:hypothetical protein EIN_399680 [Entamoeba invadens IP1]|uniref:RRM domain-containing protein n=1 Tax=Entamoeba invadens IP1 TaxID=370355 RepID=A0A0A1UA52_ENTIV|nr:hypothetical protein EIN_399680 [Entamoeba invadens IP1]ELP91928.1 hypothetical protein EIN_399680 [Entamoeba invadens IP1]|eukprot:XP_004258699.1 hypothetical protein EIN_399680 [Entamoeba invadens IP1]